MEGWDQDIPKQVDCDNPFGEREEFPNSECGEEGEQEESKEKPILVVDANAFIKCLNLTELSTQYRIVSSLNVIREIRDKRAKDKFMSLPFEIETGSCSDQSYAFISNFATKTGDFASLSATDMELIAVGYEYIKQAKKVDLLRKEPPKPINLDELRRQKKEQNQEEEDSYSDDEEEEEQDQQDNKEKEQKQQGEEKSLEETEKQLENLQINEQEKQEEKQEEDEDDGWTVIPKREVKKPKEEEPEDNGKGWINPTNIDKFLQRNRQDDLDKKIGVFIMTADYAMQNVILQTGIPLLSIDNMVIRRAKRFILECFSCKELCNDNTKLFCPTCKNDTLLKVSCSVNSDGNIVLYRKKDFRVKQRGFIYSIPKAKGGRNNKDLVLREDELMSGEKYYKFKKQQKAEEKGFKRAMMELEAGYAFGERTFKKGNEQKIVIGYGKKNPNDQYRIKNKRKK